MLFYFWYFYHKLKIMSEIVHDNWRRTLNTIYWLSRLVYLIEATPALNESTAGLVTVLSHSIGCTSMVQSDIIGGKHNYFLSWSYYKEKWKTGNESVVIVSRVAEFCRFYFIHSTIYRHRHLVVDLIITVSHIKRLTDYNNLWMTSGGWLFLQSGLNGV